jgi:WD40 repeat protein/serine/threonine protein kinase
VADKSRDEEVIFNAAIKLKKGPKREAYLARACGDDSKLRTDIEALLQAHEAKSLIDEPIFDPDVTLNTSPLTEAPGTTIGNYKLLEQIGEGGMAVVYMAEQEKPIRRRVALKIIKLGMDTRQVIARFEVERQALAVMDHPNIAKVLDAGTTETGRPYFIMELVKGVSITDYCDKNKLSTKERLELFTQVCNAVQHAHQKGIIHRDIKPSNVMVTLRDGKPVPKVIDFGIAKATSHRLTERTLFTRYAQMIGTPAYMSPEQAEMSGLDVDTQTDIYSLGVLLYELLTGATPFSKEQLREAGYLEMQRIIREEEPAKPSTKLSTLGDTLTGVAEHRRASPDLLRKLIIGDLDWIVMKSLEKNRARRYATAIELAADIWRHFNSEPVLAAAPSLSYKAHKFIRRHRIGVMASLVIAGVVIIAVVGLSISTAIIWQQKTQTQKALEGERQAVQDAQEAQTAEATAREAAEQQKKEALRQRDSAYHNQYVAQIRLAPNYWEAGQIVTLKEMLEEYLPEPGQPDLRGWEWYYLLSLCHKDLLTLRGHNSPVKSVAWSPDGQRIASGGYDTARVWDAASGKELMTLSGHSGGIVVAWSPDGRRLATGCGDKAVRLWDAATGEEMVVLRGHTGGISSIAWSPDGGRIASGSGDRTVRIWDASMGEELLTLEGYTAQVCSLAWCPTKNRLASGDEKGWVKIWDTRTGKEVITWRPKTHDLYAVAWSPDGTRLATGGYAQPLKVWDPTMGSEIVSIPHAGGIEAIAWSPDGKHIASATRAQKVRIWDVNTAQEVRTLRGHVGWVSSAAWSPDGKQLVSGGNDHTVKVWDARRDQLTLALNHAKVWAVSWNSKANTLASAGGDKIKIWDLNTSQEVRTLQGGNVIAWSLDGRRLAASSDDQTIRIWDVDTGQDMVTLGSYPGPIKSITWSLDGDRLATNLGKRIEVWDVSTGQTVSSLSGHTGDIWVVSWAPDGHRLASAGWDGLIKVWDEATEKNLLTLSGHVPGKWIESVAWSPDSKRLASGGWDQLVKVWDIDVGREVFSLRGHTALINAVAWSPNGKRIASSSSDATIKVWDSVTGQELITLRGDGERYRSVTWSPDSKQLAAACADGTVRVWDASRGHGIINSSIYTQDRARYYYKEGCRKASNERYEEACGAFGKAIELDPNFHRAYYLRGRAYSLLGKHEKSVIDFMRTVELEPNDTVAWGWLGLAPCDLRNLDAARVRAIAPNPFDGGSGVIASDTKLYWVPAKDAVGHKVYFGTDPNTLSLLRKVEETNCIRLSKLEKLRWYCWRVDSVKADGTVIKGNLWNFSTGHMVGWWKFDEGSGNIAGDSSGSGHDGIISGATWKADGWDGTGFCLEFGGDGDYLVDEDAGDYLNGLKALTISLWVKSDVTNTDKGFIIFEDPDPEKPYGGADDRDMRYDAAGADGGGTNLIKCGITSNAAEGPKGWPGRQQLESSDNTQTTKWQHLTMTWSSGNEVRLYINGKLDMPTWVEPGLVGALAGWTKLLIGKGGKYGEPNTDATGWDGLIDDVRIYSYALSEAEVKELYAGRGPGPNERPE